MSLGTFLKQERAKRKISLKELGENLRSPRSEHGSVSPQYLNDIELGRRTPSQELIEQLAKYFDVEVDFLRALGEKGHPDVDAYLRHQPMAGVEVGRLFRRAQKVGFTDWNQLEHIIDSQQPKKKK